MTDFLPCLGCIQLSLRCFERAGERSDLSLCGLRAQPRVIDLLCHTLLRGRQIQLRFFHCGLRFFVFRAVVATRVQGNGQLHTDHTGVFTITRTAIVAIACEFFASNLPDQIQ